MADCTTNQQVFSSLGRKKIQADFKGGQLTSDAGEQQLGLFADRTSCHDFVANQFRVLLSATAHVLVDALRREGYTNRKTTQNPPKSKGPPPP